MNPQSQVPSSPLKSQAKVAELKSSLSPRLPQAPIPAARHCRRSREREDAAGEDEMGGKKVGGQERIRRGDPHSRPWRGRFASITGLVSWPHPAPFIRKLPLTGVLSEGFCVSQSATSGGSEEEGKLGGWGQLPGWSLRTAPSCPWPRASSGRRRCCSSGTPGQSTQRSLNFRLPRELRARAALGRGEETGREGRGRWLWERRPGLGRLLLLLGPQLPPAKQRDTGKPWATCASLAAAVSCPLRAYLQTRS